MKLEERLIDGSKGDKNKGKISEELLKGVYDSDEGEEDEDDEEFNIKDSYQESEGGQKEWKKWTSPLIRVSWNVVSYE